MKYIKAVCLLILFSFSFISIAAAKYVSASGDALRGISSVTSPSDAEFKSVAVDDAGNIYAAGYIRGTGVFDFGKGVTASGTANDNPLLVKYDRNGDAVFAKSLVAGIEAAVFRSVALDDSGNIYAAGGITNTGVYDFGNSVTANGVYIFDNLLLIKYDSNGNAQWAKSVVSGSSQTESMGVAVDAAGNSYVTGIIFGSGSYDFGNGVTVSGVGSNGNAVLVKYNSSGDAKWAKSVIVGSEFSAFSSVAVDNLGYIYAIGAARGNSTYDFGNSVVYTGAYSAGINAVIVKYDSNGNAEWARGVTAAPDASEFLSVAVNDKGNISAVGKLFSNGSYEFGNGVTVSNPLGSDSVVCVNYNNSGDAVWAKSVTSAPGDSKFNSVALDPEGNSYAVGPINGVGNQTYEFGNDVSITGAYNGAENMALVKYNSSGDPQWGRTATSDPAAWSVFNSVTLGKNGNVYSAGKIEANKTLSLGNGVTVNGIGANTTVILGEYFGFEPINSSSSSDGAPSIVTKKLPLLLSVGGAFLML